MVYNFAFDVTYSQRQRGGIKGEVARTFLNISRELRQATSVAPGQALQGSLSFKIDYDGNGVEETIQYAWDSIAGHPLNRTFTSTVPAVNTTNAVINSVNSISFSYYDASNNPLSFPVLASQVRAVAVDVTVTERDETFTLRSRVKLRDL